MTALAAQANALIAEGRHQEALDVMGRMGDPSGNAALLQNIGVCHYRLGDGETALTWLRRAHGAAPNDAQIVNNIAVISAELGPAEVLDDTVLTASTLNDLGLNAYFHGDFHLARRRLEAAIAQKPDHYAAWHNLADLIEPAESAEWLDRIAPLSPTLPEDRAAIFYLKAHLLDQLQDYDAALAAWAEGAAARRQSFAAPFDAERHRALIGRIMDTFTTQRLRQLQTGSADERRYVFIVGLPRSGSTLTGRLLCGDPALVDLGERRALATQVIARLNTIGGSHADAFAHLTRSDAAAIYQGYVDDLAATGAFLDKYLENTLFLGLIWAAFPNAKIIHSRRDRFDCLFSCYTKNFAMGNEWTYQPADLAAYANTIDDLMAHWDHVLPPDMVMHSDYEALTQDPDTALKRMADHCGLDAAAAAARDHATGGMVRTASAKQVRQGVQRRDRSPYEAYRSRIAF